MEEMTEEDSKRESKEKIKKKLSGREGAAAVPHTSTGSSQRGADGCGCCCCGDVLVVMMKVVDGGKLRRFDQRRRGDGGEGERWEGASAAAKKGEGRRG